MQGAQSVSLFWKAGLLALLLGELARAQPAAIVQQPKGRWVLLPGPGVSKQFRARKFTPQVSADCRPSMLKSYRFSNRQLPWAVLGDFNGDKRLDLVVDGHSGKNFQRLAFLSPSYTAFLVEEGGQWKGDQWAYLEHVPPGRHDMPIGDQKALQLTCDAFCEVFPEKAAILRYWKAGKFQEYYLAD